MFDGKNVNGLLRLAAWIGLILMCVAGALAQTIAPSTLAYQWPKATATGQLGNYIALNGLTAARPSVYRIDWTVTGTAPGSCTFNAQGSADNVTWTNLDGGPAVDCTGSGSEVVTLNPVLLLRIDLAAYAAGDGTTQVIFHYTGAPGAIGPPLALGTQWGITYMSTATQMSSTAALTDNRLIKAHSGAAPAVSSVLDNGIKVSTAEFVKTGNTQMLTADATAITATTPGTIVFTWGPLPVSTSFSLHCSILYSQATAAVADGLAIQADTNAATRIDAWGTMYTTNPATTTVTASQGSTLNLTTTTATAVVTATPGATATVLQATLDATVQAGASAPTLNVLMFTGNASDAITPKAGSYCTLMP